MPLLENHAQWLLPMPNETFDDPRFYVLQLGLDWQIDHEPTPVYEHMQLFWWEPQIAKLSLGEMNRLLKNYHIGRARRRADAILLLSQIFQNMTDRAVYGSAPGRQ